MPHHFKSPKLIKDLSEDLIAEVLNAGTGKRFKRGEMIQWVGESGERMYFVLSGSVELFRMSPGGREQIIRRLGAGELFNLATALLPDGRNPVSVRALTDCEINSLSQDDLHRLMKKHPELSTRIAAYLAERLMNMTVLIEQLSLHPVRQRLAAFLMEQSESPQNLNWTQEEMARRLGTVREVISRTLREFVNEGLIRMNRNQIELLDKDLIQKTAQGSQ